MRPLHRNVHRSQIGILSGGEFVAKIMFNFEFHYFIQKGKAKVILVT